MWLSQVVDIYRTDLTTKPKAYMTLGPGLTKYNVLTAPDNHLHRTRRQLVGQALTDRSLRAFEPTMIKQIDIFIRNALSSAQRSQYFNITEEARRLGLDIAGLLSFGYDLRLQTDEQHRFMPTMLTAGTFWSSVFLQYPNARKFRFGLIAVQAFRKLHEPYLSLMQKMISSHMAEEKEAKHDLFSHIAHAFSVDVESDGLRDSDLWSEANLFLTAAGDTVKTSISAVFFYLSRNADPYQKLADEIRTTFQNGSEINGQTIAGCQYLRACVDEALRMSPPAAGILWREQASETRGQPLIVDGHVIPEGTVIGVNIYSLHHNEEYFPDSFTYRPERWVEELDPEVKKRMREAFIPFSIGPRGCAGKSMAYLETCLVIAKSLWYFDFEAAPGSLGRVGEGQPGMELGRERKEEFQLYDTFTSMHEGPYLKFQPRGNYWKDLAKNE
ncbi:cytochrome P450 [Hypoxylon trugodes]|uniref:cytochrome P450 n=1 Tax=Hypoxylon trugodes TaxID=326681 RepID=UPI0021914A4E|nr:cytochrome P450 [Hypoxylon trugodes]KAI1392971.1 cytochrome P450 [Hypoxylon trugodes]